MHQYACQRCQNLSEEKTKRENMVLHDMKNSQKMKKKGYLSIEKDITKCKKNINLL